MTRIVVVCGATASRKTELSLGLARAIGGEIVCADSVQLYAGMRIGAAAPTDAEMAQAAHHLFGVLSPKEPTNAGAYAELADTAIGEISARGATPIVVGGAGLYLRALLWGLAAAPSVPSDVREAIAAEHARVGNAGMFVRLLSVDPELAASIQGGAANTQRVLRALEVFEATGRRLSEIQADHVPALRYEVTLLAPWFEPEVLNPRIDERVNRMVAGGLVAEVQALLEDGVPADGRAMGALGYREIVAHLAGEMSLVEASLRIKRGHRKYAKRQRTWFRKEALVRRLDGVSDTLLDEALAVVQGPR